MWHIVEKIILRPIISNSNSKRRLYEKQKLVVPRKQKTIEQICLFQNAPLKSVLIMCTSGKVFHITKLKPFDAEQAWDDHLARKAERERLYPSIFDNFHTTYPFSRYPLYLVHSKRPQLTPDEKYDPHQNWLDHLDRLNDLDRLKNAFPKWWSPTPIKIGDFAPRPGEVAFNYFGQPIYTRGGLRPSKLLWSDLLNPSPFLPMSAITRDPWWWSHPSLKPYSPYNNWGRSPSYLRDSYLSPVKRTYLWDKHPIRPFAAI